MNEKEKKIQNNNKNELKISVDLYACTMAAAENVVADDMKHCYENLILIDVGANLTNKKYSRDLDAVVQRAQDSGTFFL